MPSARNFTTFVAMSRKKRMQNKSERVCVYIAKTKNSCFTCMSQARTCNYVAMFKIHTMHLCTPTRKSNNPYFMNTR